jgi:hypothetical protein|tara:strand:+ start:1017 stop:1178 length:162 start_codon:yes stop_codon:yes gene_type:complete
MTDAMILQLIVEVLDAEIGRDAYPNNTNWQDHWGLSDEDFGALQEAVDRLELA